MEKVKLETTGQKLIDVLVRAWKHPFTIKSNFAKAEAGPVGEACQLGFITTADEMGCFTNEWRITPTGLHHLYLHQTEVAEEANDSEMMEGVYRTLGVRTKRTIKAGE